MKDTDQRRKNQISWKIKQKINSKKLELTHENRISQKHIEMKKKELEILKIKINRMKQRANQLKTEINNETNWNIQLDFQLKEKQ